MASRTFAENPEPCKRPMADWYDPRQLLRTGIEVLISAAMGQRFDYRTMEDVALSQDVFDYSRLDASDPQSPLRDEMWLSYLGDTGDGWYPTHAIASLVAQPSLRVAGRELPRGAVLLLGGDQVYPTANRTNYRERLVAPFQFAFPKSDPPHPHLFAIPGNHDWYDGLVSFSRLFTHERWIGGWQTRQKRSYFALKLPHRWWLFALDIQLESDIDYGQLDYFRRVTDHFLPGDRVILASSEPDWIYRDIADPVAESNLAYLEEHIIKPGGGRVHLWVAGDLHHYKRHEKVGDPHYQRITSGGGGAFLHPTHRPAKETVSVGGETFAQKCAYPAPSESFVLSLGNLYFVAKNWKLGLATGFLYAALNWWPITTWKVVAANPSIIVWALVILGGFVFYADKDHPWFRWIGGLAHGVAHLAAAIAISRWTASFSDGGAAMEAARIVLNFLGGAIVGPTILGLYLTIALNVFGAHGNEAFSALRIEGFKHFLRLHVRPDGRLEIFPIGVKNVSHDDRRLPDFSLIEPPIIL